MALRCRYGPQSDPPHEAITRLRGRVFFNMESGGSDESSERQFLREVFPEKVGIVGPEFVPIGQFR